MKRLFYIFCISAIFLSGCAKKEPTTAIADSIKSDINIVEQQIEDFKQDLPSECKTPTVKVNLTTIQANIKTLAGKVDNLDKTCLTRLDVLKEENSKLKIIIGFLILIIIGYIILKIRKIL